MAIDLEKLTLARFARGLRSGEFSAQEITREYLGRIREKDGDIRAYLNVREEQAIKDAEKADAEKDRNSSPLLGAPIAVKDNMLLKGEITTAGSKILADYKASYDAYAVRRLKDAGTAILGKTNLDEFAMGSSTENSGFYVTRNPHDTERVPGGSSGGSAAAVAADMALSALGSDTGGSIRQPAGLCGVAGLKPTYGAVSRSGLIAMASSLDQIGTFGKTAQDTAILFQAIRGADPMDATSAGAPEEGAYDEALLRPDLDKMKKLRIGLPQEYFETGLSPEAERTLDEVRSRFEKMGFELETVSLPHTRYALASYYVIVPAEVSANLARFDGIRYSRPADAPRNLLDLYRATRGRGFGPEVKRRIILGTFVLSSGYYDAYYETAQKVRLLVRRDFEDAFKKADVLLAPVTPGHAWKIGEKADDPLAMYMEDVFTLPVNMAGLPGLSLPSRTDAKLPIGFQLIGRRFEEPQILGLGQLYEREFAAELYD